MEIGNDVKEIIDITYDFRRDSNGGDPDQHSATLRRYHKLLWTKSLPNGALFKLDDKVNGVYLYFKYDLYEYFLSSDAITHSYSKWKRMQHIIEKIPKIEVDKIFDMGCTIGAYIIFPCNKIDNFKTINQERGVNKYINDRFDLTLECIRLYYDGCESPLQKIFDANRNYFSLFKNFKGFCDFFLLQDLVTDDFTKVKFFLPFNSFVFNPLPSSVDEYLEYRDKTIEFIKNRNNRIQNFSRGMQ